MLLNMMMAYNTNNTFFDQSQSADDAATEQATRSADTSRILDSRNRIGPWIVGPLPAEIS